jgi:hypothetical protein
VLVRFSQRIAALIEREIAPDGVTEVRLAGLDARELIHADGTWRPADAPPGASSPALLPLCDWRALVWDRRPDRALALLPADPGDPAVIAAAAASQADGPYPALRSGEVLVLPALPRWRSRMRAIQCAATDPVSLALVDGRGTARFPNAGGWSAPDVARRAVAEHRAWVEAEPAADGDVLGRLITAARAALFEESLGPGQTPSLALTVAETLRRLSARSPAGRAVAEDVAGSYREYAFGRTQPTATTMAAMRHLVRGLPGYSGGARPRQEADRTSGSGDDARSM